jgi:hypothetical protein
MERSASNQMLALRRAILEYRHLLLDRQPGPPGRPCPIDRFVARAQDSEQAGSIQRLGSHPALAVLRSAAISHLIVRRKPRFQSSSKEAARRRTSSA